VLARSEGEGLLQAVVQSEHRQERSNRSCGASESQFRCANRRFPCTVLGQPAASRWDVELEVFRPHERPYQLRIRFVVRPLRPRPGERDRPNRRALSAAGSGGRPPPVRRMLVCSPAVPSRRFSQRGNRPCLTFTKPVSIAAAFHPGTYGSQRAHWERRPQPLRTTWAARMLCAAAGTLVGRSTRIFSSKRISLTSASSSPP